MKNGDRVVYVGCPPECSVHAEGNPARELWRDIGTEGILTTFVENKETVGVLFEGEAMTTWPYFAHLEVKP
jgi:hypothetical protein